MDKEIIFVVEEDLEGGYSVKALGFSIFTQGETMQELKQNIKNAISCHFDKESDILRVILLHMVKEKILSYA
jgi:predicted RNase H-like HicB family nuclease